MNTMQAMVPRKAFIVVYMKSNRKHGALTIGMTSKLGQHTMTLAL
jgi:hypothetical protein